MNSAFLYLLIPAYLVLVAVICLVIIDGSRVAHKKNQRHREEMAWSNRQYKTKKEKQ